MCQITEPTEHEIKLLLDNQQLLWDRLRLSSKNWYSPTDSLRYLTLLPPNFLCKNVQCQNDGKGKGQAWHGELLIFSVKMHLFWLWLSRYSQRIQDGAKNYSPSKPPPHTSTSPRIIFQTSIPCNQPAETALAGVHVREQTSSRYYFVPLQTEFKHICSALGFWSGNSVSVCPCAFISVMQQQFNHSSNLRYDSRNDTAKVHFCLPQQLQITAACFSAYEVVCLYLSFWCFSGVGFCFDLKAGEREGKVTVNLKNLWMWKLCVLFQVMHVISCLFICDCNYPCVDNVGVRRQSARFQLCWPRKADFNLNNKQIQARNKHVSCQVKEAYRIFSE